MTKNGPRMINTDLLPSSLGSIQMRFLGSGVLVLLALEGSRTLPLHLVAEVAVLHRTCLSNCLARWEAVGVEGQREVQT